MNDQQINKVIALLSLIADKVGVKKGKISAAFKALEQLDRENNKDYSQKGSA